MKPELINSLKNYKKKNIFNDLFAGLMVAIIALPLSIALGIQSVPKGAPINGIQCGIITAIIAGFLISALGGSKFQIGGPTAAFVVILYGYLANPDIGVLGLAIAGIMAGVLLIIMGFCKCGSVMKFFPYPITIVFDLTYGVLAGVGVTALMNALNYKKGLKIAPAEESGDNVVKCKGALYFINANKLVSELSKRVATSDSVTLDLSQVESIDQTALEKICTFNKKLKAENKTLIITGENQKIKTRLQKYFNAL